MKNETFKKLQELQFALWKICNDEFCKRQSQQRKREERKKEKGEQEKC